MCKYLVDYNHLLASVHSYTVHAWKGGNKGGAFK